jgi:hypothetical protein
MLEPTVPGALSVSEAEAVPPLPAIEPSLQVAACDVLSQVQGPGLAVCET